MHANPRPSPLGTGDGFAVQILAANIFALRQYLLRWCLAARIIGVLPKAIHDHHLPQYITAVLDNEPCMKRIVLHLLAGGVFLGACVPQSIVIKPVRVEPIHMTVDVNIHDQAKEGKTEDARSDGTGK